MPSPAEAAPSRVAAVHGLSSPFGVLSLLLSHQAGWPLPYLAALRRITSSRRFDVIHYHNVSLFGPGVLTVGKADAKLYTAHEHWLVCPTHVLWKFRSRACEKPQCLRCVLASRRPPQAWRYTSLLARCAAHVDRFFAPSQAVVDMHAARGFGRPMDVLPIFTTRADADWQQPGPSPWPRPYFFFAGRLEAYKGLHTVIPHFATGDVDLLVAGEGPAAGALRAQAAGNPRIRFLGTVAEAQLGPYYAHAIACLAPSLTFETFGTVTLEAFARKTPVIARDLGALAEPVQESGGGMAYRSDVDLAEAMRRLVSDVGLRDEMGERGYRMFLERWAPEPHLRRYLARVDEALAARVAAGETGR